MSTIAQNKRHDVVGIGHAIIDLIKETQEDMPQRLGLTKGAMTLLEHTDQAHAILTSLGGAESCQSIAGGSVGNTIAALAALGHNTAFIGNVADDTAGSLFVKGLEENNTLFSRAGQVPEGEISGNCCICVTPDGERTMATYLGASRALSAESIDNGVIDQASIVYAEAYLWDDGALKDIIPDAFARAKQSGALTAFSLSDPFCVERHRETICRFVESGAVDILFGNEDEISMLYPDKTIKDVTDIFHKKTNVVFMTCGASGADILSDGQQHHVDAVGVDHVVDTTGAGDLFAAGALHALLSGASYTKAGTYGCKAASHIITRIGGRSGDEFKELMRA